MLGVVLLFGFCQLTAQTIFKSKKISASSNLIQELDTQCIVLSSVKVYKYFKTLASSDYNVNAISASIQILNKNILQSPYDSLLVFYKTFDFSAKTIVAKNIFDKDLAIVNRQRILYNNLFNNNIVNKEDEIYYGIESLAKSGSIARGITVGNNQNLSVNSALNFQLNGALPNGFNIAAVITDDNLPLQASGTTQQLQEFDKVYVQIEKNKNKIIAGDFQQENTQNYFLKYNKRLQGIYTSIFAPLAKNNNITNELGAAISRGKFSRNIIQGVEGNQGPYKLRGAENEGFIVILSGTERVFIDGYLVTRGQDNDYTIDYNTAEITFTPKKLITKDRRIVVEFQYSDKNYVRSMIIYAGNAQVKNSIFYWNYYNERDNKNRPVQQTLSESDKLLLVAAGNNLQKTQALSADSVAFNNNAILYKKLDTLINNVLYKNIFIYSTSPSNAFFQLSFSNVGQGKGNYIQDFKNGNGVTYTWVAPIGGLLQGSFEPIIQLIAPKKREMISVGTHLIAAKNLTIDAEIAVSNKDENTFSNLDDNNNKDFANRILISKKIEISKIDTTRFFIGTLSHEQQNSYFSTVERYRSVEFERDWNLQQSQTTGRQTLQKLSLVYANINKGKSIYTIGLLNELNASKGLQHRLENIYNTKKFSLNLISMYTNLTSTMQKSKFLRARWQSNIYFKKFTLINNADLEQNNFYSPVKLKSDPLLANSYQHIDYWLGISNKDTAKLNWKLIYNNRYDFKPLKNIFSNTSIANGLTASVNYIPIKNQCIKFTASYRDLLVTNNLLLAQKPENTTLLRSEYDATFWKGFIINNLFYETGSGLEQRRAFSYLLVGAGQGVYYWNDYNNNGVKEINEFEVSQFPDQALYVKVFTITNDYVKAYNNSFSNTLNINGASLRELNSRIIKKFSNQFYTRADFKTRNQLNVDEVFNRSLKTGIALDTNTISSNFVYRNTLFFNKGSGLFGFDFSIQQNSNKTLLSDGFDFKGIKQYGLNLRFNFSTSFTLNVEALNSNKLQKSDFLTQRNFTINSNEIESRITFQQNATWQVSASARFIKKKETIVLANVDIQKYVLEGRYTATAAGSINIKFSYLAIKSNLLETTPLAFEMLESLGAGNNFTWQIYWQQSLNKNLQLNLIYDARKNASLDKIIQTGNIQLRALF